MDKANRKRERMTLVLNGTEWNINVVFGLYLQGLNAEVCVGHRQH